MYLALRLVESPQIEANDGVFKGIGGRLELPEGVIGLMYVFKTKKAARKYYGKGVELQKIQYNHPSA